MELPILFGVSTLLLAIGTPVAFCLGIASLATVLYMQLPPIVVFQQLNSGMNTFAMIAIPFFIYAGCAVGKITMGEAMRTIWPLLGASVAVLMLVTYVPGLTLGCLNYSAERSP